MKHLWKGASLTIAALAAPGAATMQSSPPPPACIGPEHRQFDFWVGRWDVYRTGDTAVRAHSMVERLHGGCVIRERWMPLQGEGGSSLNHYDRSEGRWHQSWMDSSNGHVTFDGGLVAGKMVLTGFWKDANGPGNHGLVRMSYSRLDGGAVRQFGEISTDHGTSWSPFFDFTYRPAATAK